MGERIPGVNAGSLDKAKDVVDKVSPDGDQFDANLDYKQGEGGRVVVTEGAKERISGRQTHGFFTNGSARDLEEGQSLKEDGYMGATSSSNSSAMFFTPRSKQESSEVANTTGNEQVCSIL